MEFMNAPDFQLIETMLLPPGEGIYLLEGHINRLSESAAHFGFRFARRDVIASLERVASELDPETGHRIRLLLHRDGTLDISSAPVAEIQAPRRAALSAEAVNSRDDFLYHKTTRRELFDRKTAECRDAGLYDFIFINERGELTEGAWNNLAIETGGRLLTPPVSCGLLDGVFRRTLIETGRASEKILKPANLLSADNVFLCNSVRGLVSVEILTDTIPG